jgi:four helix bundle protein
MLVERFEDLNCWQTSRALTRQIYLITNTGDFTRDFGLRDQIRRASVSIMSNIVEGFESRTRKLFVEFLGRAKGSAGELRCRLCIASDVKYLNEHQFNDLYELADKNIRQISNLMRYLKSHPETNKIKDVFTFLRFHVSTFSHVFP